MSGDPCEDPAAEVIDVFIRAMRTAFNDSLCPPVGGGSTEVRFVPGDGALPLFDAGGKGCKTPLLWVRAAHRYRSTRQQFPTAVLGTVIPCADVELIDVLLVEVGIGRCTSIGRDATPKWDSIAREAEISLDDSWRITKVQCAAGKQIKALKRAAAHDTVAPAGPEGGAIFWTGLSYIEL